MNFQEASQAMRQHLAIHADRGIYFQPGVEPAAYVPDEFRRNFPLAMDAQPSLISTSNAGIPAFLTTLIDPKVFKILLAPNKLAEIFGEERKGSWLDQTQLFPTVERTGEVSSYGDYSENGHVGLNTMWPQRQSYLFQTVKDYGELELERAGLARISWAAEQDEAAATVLMKFLNFTYAFGVAGLQNYGLLNDPSLPAAITPATKAAGGTQWVKNGVINATANEIYNDIQALFIALVNQSNDLINEETKVVLAMSPQSGLALTAANSFNVNVRALLKENFPNIRIETCVQYAQVTASNPQGIAAGNLVQMIAEEVGGQETGYCAFNEKMRAHPVIRALSSFRQKVTCGTWGAIVRQPFAVSQMLGV